jgi:anaerobic dimethyl sulfoxide reductase subunit B
MSQRAFYIDMTGCTGCKACQMACKDKHDLEVGRLWRRVADVEGGGWARLGAAWQSTVFAYSLSLACMHCERPACRDACPTKAIVKRDDGVVYVATDRCIGCRYCEWTCPYGALHFDARARRMTKCDLCRDEIDHGRPPACVAACPMRVLEVGEVSELRSRYGSVCDVYPLPDGKMTGPSLVLTPHRDAVKAAQAGAAVVANREDI